MMKDKAIVSWNKVSVAKLQAMGLPVPPTTADHVLVIVEAKSPASNVVTVTIRYVNADPSVEMATNISAIAFFNETRMAAAMVPPPVGVSIDDAVVDEIIVEEYQLHGVFRHKEEHAK